MTEVGAIELALRLRVLGAQLEVGRKEQRWQADFGPASLVFSAGFGIVEVDRQQIKIAAAVVVGVEANEEARISHVGLRM